MGKYADHPELCHFAEFQHVWWQGLLFNWKVTDFFSLMLLKSGHKKQFS